MRSAPLESEISSSTEKLEEWNIVARNGGKTRGKGELVRTIVVAGDDETDGFPLELLYRGGRASGELESIDVYYSQRQ